MTDKLIVIGSNSFSGSHFVAGALAKGMDVVGISRSKEQSSVYLPYKWRNNDGDNRDSNSNRNRNENKRKAIQHNKFSFFKLDLNNDLDAILSLIFDFRPDYIVNFAAQGMVAESWNAPEQWFKTNMLSAVQLHNRLKDCTFLKKFVQISTPEVYGSCQGDVNESISYNPSTPYAVSKAGVDMSLMTFFRQYNFPVIFTRSANVYGPGQQLYRIIPRSILFFLTGKKLELHGGGRSVRAFIHIKDVVNGTLKAMLYGKPGNIYHFSSSETLSIRSLVKLIAEKTGVSFKDKVTDVDDRLGKDKAYLLNCSKAYHEFGWKARMSLDNGIEETMGWIKNNLDVLKNEPLNYIHKP